MNIWKWLTLEKRVARVEKIIQRLEQENIALISTPFLEPLIEDLEGGVVRGREVEEDSLDSAEDSVEEREYMEEVKWLAQRKQKEKMV